VKRFYSKVGIEQAEGGWCVTLDERPIRTHRGAVQLVPARSLAELLAGEWRAQGEEVDPKAFVFRDIADYAIDMVAPDRATAIATTLRFAESDTLCYRADPDEPLYRRQQELWEPLIAQCESSHGVALERVSGIVHRPHPPETLAKLRQTLEVKDDFTLAALQNLASLATSLVTGLAVLEPDANAEELFAAANCEEDWQAEQWGWDVDAKKRRDARLAGFLAAASFANAARG
jgi:chaperone required for assembly of F1-ATPase